MVDVIGALMNVFNTLRDSAEFALSSGNDRNKSVVIFAFIGLTLLVVANMFGLVSINSMIYGQTDAQLQPFPRADITLDEDAFLNNLDMVTVYRPAISGTATSVSSWEEVWSANLAEPWGVIWHKVNNELFGYAIPSFDMVIYGRDADYSFAPVAYEYNVISNNGTSAGYWQDVEDFVTMIEDGDICFDDMSWDGMQRVPFSYDSAKFAMVSDCLFLRDATTKEQVSLLQACAITGADCNSTVFSKIYSDLGITQLIEAKDLNYKQFGLLTPFALIDGALEWTAGALDTPSMAVFDVKIFTPLYQNARSVIIWLAFLSICLFCLTLVWNVANK